MTLRLNSILIGSDDPKQLGSFYGEVLQAKPGWEEGGYIGFDAGNFYLMVGPHDKVHGKSANPERVIFNFESDDFGPQYQRIKGIEGITVIQEPYSPGESTSMKLATFADPDGNYFQLATPMAS